MNAANVIASTTSADVRAITYDRAVTTLVLAFADDPIIRWFLPDTDRYLAHFPVFVRALGGAAFDAGTAEGTVGDSGTAVWVPPGVELDDEKLGELLVESIAPDRQAATFAFLEQVSEFHPHETHWYLPFIGVEPGQQGRGLGSALLRSGLRRADGDALPSYLEASKPRNRDLYLRHGYELVGEIQVADSPPLWPMMRAPRPAESAKG
jgi:GNAT superfamily N-acetyltransferase